jgi:cysteine-rich repeat protein
MASGLKRATFSTILAVAALPACGEPRPAAMDEATTEAGSSGTSDTSSRTGSDGDPTTSTGLADSSESSAAADSSTGDPGCGDAIVDVGEACDDGNLADGDGCNRDCVVSGTLLWTVTYDGPAHLEDRGRSVAIGSDGHVVAVGTRLGGSSAVWIERLAPDGTVDWTSNDGSGNDGADKVVLDSADELVVCGNTSAGAWVRKYDVAGTRLWEGTRSADGGQISCRALVLGIDDSVIAMGQEYPDGGYPTGWIARWESNGEPAWSEAFSFSEYAYPHDAILTDDGGIVATGHEYGGVGGNSNWLARWEPEGPGTSWEQHLAIQQHVTFFVDDPPDSLLLVRIDNSTLDVDWSFLDDDGAKKPGSGYQLPEDVVPFAAAFDPAGNMAVAGVTPGVGGTDAWLGKFAPDGTQLWTAVHDGPGTFVGLHNDEYSALAIDPDGAIVLVGSEDVDTEGRNILVHKYAP